MPSIRDEFGRILDLRWSLARDQCASQPICALRAGPNRGKTPKSCSFKNEGIPELVMGNRFLGGIAPGAMPWKNRYIGNPLLSGIGRVLFQTPIKDFHCGLRAFSKDAFQRMDLRTTGMEFASEMIIKANSIPVVRRSMR